GFIGGTADAAAFARREKVSVEMAARQLRHHFLARTARRLKIHTVALANHGDEQLELYFLRLLRGSSGEGLAGMKWAGPSTSNASIQLIRPLLDQPKAALRTFAEQQGIAFREDATNARGDFLRNREKSPRAFVARSEEHTSELQSRGHLVCRLLLEKKNRYVLLLVHTQPE